MCYIEILWQISQLKRSYILKPLLDKNCNREQHYKQHVMNNVLSEFMNKLCEQIHILNLINE